MQTNGDCLAGDETAVALRAGNETALVVGQPLRVVRKQVEASFEP